MDKIDYDKMWDDFWKNMENTLKYGKVDAQTSCEIFDLCLYFFMDMKNKS